MEASKNWFVATLEHTYAYLKSGFIFPWLVLGAWASSTARTQFSHFHKHDGVIDILTSFTLEVIVLFALVYAMTWKGRFSYSMLALFAGISIFAPIALFYLYVRNWAFTRMMLTADWGYLVTVALEVLIVTFSIPVLVLSIRYLRHGIGMQNKLEKMSTADMLRMHIEANVVYGECVRSGDKNLAKVQRKTQTDSNWTKYELQNRDPQIEVMLNRMGDDSNKEAMNEAADALLEKYGEEALDPIRKDWPIRESHYFKI